MTPFNAQDWKIIMDAINASSWQGSAVEHVAAAKAKVQERIDHPDD